MSKNEHRIRLVEWEGEKVPLRELCKKFDKHYNTVSTRLRRGWTLEEALERPVNNNPPDKKAHKKEHKRFGAGIRIYTTRKLFETFFEDEEEADAFFREELRRSRKAYFHKYLKPLLPKAPNEALDGVQQQIAPIRIEFLPNVNKEDECPNGES